MKTLYLIDGFAQFFRAYHAIRSPMSSPVTGEPTNLPFGFLGMMFKLIRGEGLAGEGEHGRPDYIAVTLDVSGDTGTFRSELYPEYKANREGPPEDFSGQLERALQALKLMKVPMLGSPGFEADDVIATLSSTFSVKHPDVRVRIVSKDKDLKQLLGSGVPPTEMYDVHKDELITAESMRADLGIGPEQVVDMLTLMGDTADNIPGVPGIGPKTAAQLLSQFGTLDAVLEETLADKPKKDWVIKGKRRENIAAWADRLPLSKQLVTLRHDVPVELDLEAAAIERFDLPALSPLLKELGFNRFQNELLDLVKAGGGSAADVREGGGGGGGKTERGSRSVGGFTAGLFDQTEHSTIETDGDYTRVTTEADLSAVIEELQGAEVVAVDTETTALRPMKARLAGVCLSIEPGRAWYVPVLAPEGEDHLDEATVLSALRPVLEDPSVPKVGHNLKYDMLVLRRCGVELRGHVPTGDAPIPVGDTMMMSFVADATRTSHSMDALTVALLGREPIPIKELIGSGKSQRRFDEVPLDQATSYAAEDADLTLRLARSLCPGLGDAGLWGLYRDIEAPLVDVLAEMEWNGTQVDPDELDRQREGLQERIDELKDEIATEAMETIGRGFEPGSPKQLSGILFNKPDAEDPGLGLRASRRTKTGYSTDSEVLEKLSQDPSVESRIPGLILEYRQLTKLVGTYLVALKEEINEETGRIHASFNQTGAATGRLSSSDPNLQNIPIRTEIGRRIRRAFIAPEGRALITADYSQIELRLLAHLAEDDAMIEAFDSGEDIHTTVAAQVEGVDPSEVTREQRSNAKMVNFGIIYGVTKYGLARRLGVSDDEAEGIISGYLDRFKGIKTFMGSCVAFAADKGYVETMLGRRRKIEGLDARNQNQQALAARVAINSVVQGSAADLIKLAMLDLHARLSPHAAHLRDGAPPEIEGVSMQIQIHDELVFEAPEADSERARDLIVSRMEAAMDLRVPLRVDASISTRWDEAK